MLWRPWYDAAAAPAVYRLYFPLSRAWAAALAAEGDPDRFRAALGADWPGRVSRRSLDSTSRRAEAHALAASAWDTGFFGPEPVSASALTQAERRRQRAAFRLMSARGYFFGAHLRRAFPPVRYCVAPEAEVVARHGHRLVDPDGGFAPDPELPVGESRSVGLSDGRRRWLRFSAGDPGTPDPRACAPAFARVREPAGIAPRGTVVFAHGIGMEDEFWGHGAGIGEWYLQRGFRIVEPEGPWHGRRRVHGFYGGEPVLAFGPGGPLDYFRLHVPELGRLVAWARALGDGPVALAGVSLGAMTASRLISAAGTWPAAARPDAALLVAPAAAMRDVAFEGVLSAGVGLPEAAARAGWTEAALARWAPLLDPGPQPAIDPDRVVVVLGRLDTVAPYASGGRLVRRWAVPEANVWRRDQGHFSVSLGLAAAPAPLLRLEQILLRL